ncbi:MAG TPA: hypothetical protein VMW91_08980 [Desulfosporosinus sp.]|nr:hypothetical protein [Desulfosporosinus sp.]
MGQRKEWRIVRHPFRYRSSATHPSGLAPRMNGGVRFPEVAEFSYVYTSVNGDIKKIIGDERGQWERFLAVFF